MQNNPYLYHFPVQFDKRTFDKIEMKAEKLYPSLDSENAVIQFLRYIIHSILMDFHPQDLYINSIQKNPNSEFKAFKIDIPQSTALSFATKSLQENKNSFAALSYEMRKCLYGVFLNLSSGGPESDLITPNSFGMLSQ